LCCIDVDGFGASGCEGNGGCGTSADDDGDGGGVAVVDVIAGIVDIVFIDDAAVVGDVVIVSDGRG